MRYRSCGPAGLESRGSARDSPQYVKLARLLRDKITSGQYKHGDPLPAASLASEHKVSVRVVWHTMDMLAANRYVHRPGNFAAYVVTWQAGA